MRRPTSRPPNNLRNPEEYSPEINLFGKQRKSAQLEQLELKHIVFDQMLSKRSGCVSYECRIERREQKRDHKSSPASSYSHSRRLDLANYEQLIAKTHSFPEEQSSALIFRRFAKYSALKKTAGVLHPRYFALEHQSDQVILHLLYPRLQQNLYGLVEQG